MEPFPKILGESAYEPPSPVTRLTGRLTYDELEEINNRVTAAMAEVLMKREYYSPELERETVMEMIDKLKNTPMDFGDFQLPPPKVTSVSYSPEDGYVVCVDQSLPPIPNWVEIRASFNDSAFNQGVPNQEGDVVTDMQGETFECEKTYLGKGPGPFGLPMGFPTDLPVDNLMDFQVAGESKLKVQPSGEVIVPPGGPYTIAPYGVRLDGPTGPVGSPGAPGQPGISSAYPAPSFLRSSSTKPLMYSVDVYRSLKEAQFVAISSFPIVDINKGTKIKPYAVGSTVQEAEDKLAQSIQGWTGRKELGVINEHLHITQYVCVHCSNPTGYPTKQDLIEHIGLRHNGNISVEKYTNPSVVGVWLKLP